MTERRNKRRRPAIAAVAVTLCAPLPLFAQVDKGSGATLPTVEVNAERDRPGNGYQSGIIRSTKTAALAKDIPQAITVVTESLILDRNADTLREALRNVAGLTFNAGEGGRIGDNMMLRGFYTFGDLYLDGIRDVAQYNRETFYVEQIDVLRGSGAMLFGRGQAGGVINQVAKSAMLSERASAVVTLGDHAYKRATADINRKIGENTAARVAVMKTDAGSSRDGVSSNREGIAPSLRWGIGTANEFSLAYLYLKTNNVLDYGVPFFDRRPLDVPANRFYGTSSDFENNVTDMATATYIHRFSPVTELKTVLRLAEYKRELWGVAPRLAGNPTAITDATTINRQRQARGGEESTATSQTDFTTRFEAAGLKHEVLVGLELLQERAGRWNFNSIPTAVAPATTVGNPDPSPVLPAGYGNRIRNGVATYSGFSTGLYAQDTLEFRPGWKLLAGLRKDTMDADYSNGARVNFDEWSYRSGLLYQPNDYHSYYAALSDSFNPTADLYQLTPAQIVFGPERSRTLELGAKWELFEGDLSLRTALYRATKTNERNTDLEQANTALLSRKRHTDGFEIELAGRITSRWEIFGGLALMKALIDEAATNPFSAGMRPRNSPPYTANLWTSYRLDGGWRVGMGMDAKGARLGYGLGGSTPISVNVAPRYVRWDALVAYEQPRYTVRLNLLNLFNTRYYESVYENGGHVVPGTLRTAQITTEFKF